MAELVAAWVAAKNSFMNRGGYENVSISKQGHCQHRSWNVGGCLGRLVLRPSLVSRHCRFGVWMLWRNGGCDCHTDSPALLESERSF